MANIQPAQKSYGLRYINILSFRHENVGQGYVVEKRYLRHSIANMNVRESHTEHFCGNSYRTIDFENFDQYHVVEKKRDSRRSVASINLD